MKARILCAGVAVLDLIMNLDEMPRRADKYRTHSARITGGGCAANAAVAIARLGGDCALATRLGDDALADLVIGDLERERVDCRWARRCAGQRTSFSSIYVDRHGERQIVNFRDPDLPRDADWIGPLDDFDAFLADTRWPEGAARLLAAARRLGKPGVLDAESPFERCDAALDAASHAFFSAEGLREFSGIDALDAALAAAAERLDAVVGVTDGADGARWIAGGRVHHAPAYAVDVVDTLGAGDTWHGAVTLALAEARELPAAIDFANAAAALKCPVSGGRDGTPQRAAVERFLERRRPPGRHPETAT